MGMGLFRDTGRPPWIGTGAAGRPSRPTDDPVDLARIQIQHGPTS